MEEIEVTEETEEEIEIDSIEIVVPDETVVLEEVQVLVLIFQHPG
jgi:hypothetical protein